MKCYIIAQIVNGFGKVVGYRLFDADSSKGEIMNVPTDNIKQVLKKDPELVKNARLVNGEVSGTNGKLDRYAKIDSNGNLIPGEKSPLVVLNKIENVGYTVVDFKGQKIKISNEKAVEYAREHGIANGKVVEQDNIEFISSITDSYEVVKLPTSKVGSNTKVNIPIRIGSDAASVAKHTAEDIETEMQYNDVFQAMTPEQRSVLKQYYTWYTVDCYKKMAKNVRLDLAPGKAEKLAQLRGIDKWEFAGINDSYLSGNFKAHCELGHRLRYEYFAIPEGVLDKDYKVRSNRVRTGLSKTSGQKDAVQELRDAGAIVFGETCAGDFFHISPEDMKKLVKTRKTMSDEIELMSNILTNKLETEYTKKCKLLYQVLNKLNSGDNIIDAFGDNIGYTLIAFMKSNMPFPMSLVILAGSKVREDYVSFWCKVFPEYKGLITEMGRAEKNPDISATGLVAGGCLLKFIGDYTIEGKYQYDPTTDNDNLRKDIGRYNKETREERSSMLQSLINGTSVNARFLDSIEYIEAYLKSAKYMVDMCKLVEAGILNTELKNKFTLKQYADYLDKSMYKYNSSEDFEEISNLTEEQKYMISFVSSAMTFSKEVKTGFKIVEVYYGNRYTYYRGSVFKMLVTASYMSRIGAWKKILEIKDAIDSMNSSQQEIVDYVLGRDNDKLKEELERERTRMRYYVISLKSSTDEKFDEDKVIVAKLDYITNQEFLNAMKNNTPYAINTNEVDDESKLLDTDKIYAYNEIGEEAYNSYLESIMFNRRHYRRMKAQREEDERLERERLDRLAEEQRLKEEALAKAEMEGEAKLDKLKSLIDKYINKYDYYGIRTAKAILDTGIKYSMLKPKQKWRINKTLEELENIEKNGNQSIDYDLNSITEPKKVEITEPIKEDVQSTYESEKTIDAITEKQDTNIENKVEDTKPEIKEDTSKIDDTDESKPKTVINEDKIKGINDADAEKAVRLLLNNVVIKEEKDPTIAFATKIALTVNRMGTVSDKQKNYLMIGYNKYIETRGKGGK